MAQFYADENFDYPVVERLRVLGHDVLTVQEAGQRRRSALCSRLTAGTFPVFTKKAPHMRESSVAPGTPTRTPWRAESITPPLGRWPVNTFASTGHPECTRSDRRRENAEPDVWTFCDPDKLNPLS